MKRRFAFKPRLQQGFTLIEMIIAMVMLAVAMVSFTSFLVPQFADSADPHYQTRAVALGQSVMSQITSRQFDHNSDTNGGVNRCSETGWDPCSSTLGADGSEAPADFNDVDDYIGCWHTPNTEAACINSTTKYPLSEVFVDGDSDQYRNFRLEISVAYNNLDGETAQANKKIEMTIFSGSSQSLKLIAHRGNY